MEANEKLENIVKYRKRFNQEDAVRLSDVVGRVVKGKSEQQKRYGKISEAWSQLLSQTLLEHCRIVDIQSGVLKVRVDSVVYRQELEWCRDELLQQMQRRCGRSRVKEIKIVSGR